MISGVVDDGKSPLARDIVQKLSCPYHPSFPLEIRDLDFVCGQCERRFHTVGGVLDLRTDELREGSAGWTPGAYDWKPGLLSLVVGESRPAPDAQADGETLDIGCGARPSGATNVDVYLPDPVPANFLMAAADKLPFLPKSFDRVVSRYVIEHVSDPFGFMLECATLARDEVEIVTDNSDWLGDVLFRILGRGRIFHPEHVFKWSKEYLAHLAGRTQLPYTIRLETLSETRAVRAVGSLARGPILEAFLHRDLRLTIDARSYSPSAS